MIVTVTPSPAVDWTVAVDSFEFSAVNIVAGRTREASGKGVNVSVALNRNSIRTLAVFPAGGETGQFICSELESQGVATEPIDSAVEVRTNITLIVPGHSGTKINEPGEDPGESARQELKRAVRTRLVSVQTESSEHDVTLAICGSLPPGTPVEFQRELIRVGRELGVRTVVDASAEVLSASIAEHPDLIKPNVHELAAETGRSIRTLGDVVEAAAELRQRGVGAVLASLGADGMLLVDGEGALYGKATDIPVINTVGAGDASLAGFLAGLDGGAERAGCLRMSLLYASSAVGHETTLFTVDPSLDSNIHVTEDFDRHRALDEPARALHSTSQRCKDAAAN